MKIKEEDKIAIQKAIDEKLIPIASFLENINKHINILNPEIAKSLLNSFKSIDELKEIFLNIEAEIEYDTTYTDIEGFPYEVIEWMLQQQKIQYNVKNINIFKLDRTASSKGFYWSKIELPKECKYNEQWFCNQVIQEKNFDVFFEVFPKESTK